MINILYIGAHPTSKLIRESEGKIDSLYRTNDALSSGFRSVSGVNFNCITSPDIDSFPKNKLFYKADYDKTDDTLMVSLLNVPIIKQIWRIFAMTRTAKKIIRSNQDRTYLIIPYIVFHHVFAAGLIKILCGNKVDVGIIVPDIFFPKNRVMKLLNRVSEKIVSKFSFYVLYTEAMADYLMIRDKKYIVIEGFHKVNISLVKERTGKFVITYAGSLNICYGIKRLVDAFSLLNYQDVELHLYGSGDAEALIREGVTKDSRIKFYGRVSKIEANDALYGSSILINPRNATDGEFVQYSFPSKDIDYLASGVPCVLCKLPGMPKEYYGHFIDAGDGSAESLAAAINEAYSMTPEQRESLAIRAQRFITERMDTKKQAERIIQLINS